MNDRVRKFIDEYKALCDRHGLMVFSDGESVEVGTLEAGYWGIEESTEDWIATLPTGSKEYNALQGQP
jgi:hypothetical protein